MDATSFALLAAVTVVMSFNLTASLMCCRSLGRRVDRLEDRLDKRIDGTHSRMDRVEQRMLRVEQRMDRVEQRMDRLEQRMDRLEQRMDRVEQRMDRMEQVLMQLVADMALVKAKLGIETASPAVTPQPAIAPSSGTAAQ